MVLKKEEFRSGITARVDEVRKWCPTCHNGEKGCSRDSCKNRVKGYQERRNDFISDGEKVIIKKDCRYKPEDRPGLCHKNAGLPTETCQCNKDFA